MYVSSLFAAAPAQEFAASVAQLLPDLLHRPTHAIDEAPARSIFPIGRESTPEIGKGN
jgi:hypothetical protein